MDRPDESKLPPGMVAAGPPAAVVTALRDVDKATICGARLEFTWVSGPKKGLPVTVYCQVPACIDLGTCPEPMFVPHMEQYTHPTGDVRRRLRKMDPGEVVAAVREASRLAKGAAKEKRSDKEIAEYVGQVWRATVRAIRGGGRWSP